MADQRTGKLRHREHWCTGKQIDRKAGICDQTRKKYMRELVAHSLARMGRLRVESILTDRGLAEFQRAHRIIMELNAGMRKGGQTSAVP